MQRGVDSDSGPGYIIRPTCVTVTIPISTLLDLDHFQSVGTRDSATARSRAESEQVDNKAFRVGLVKMETVAFSQGEKTTPEVLNLRTCGL